MELGIFAKSHFLLLDFLILCLCFYKIRKTFNISVKVRFINYADTFRIVKYKKVFPCFKHFLYIIYIHLCVILFFPTYNFQKKQSALSDCCLLRFCMACGISYEDKKAEMHQSKVQSLPTKFRIRLPKYKMH